MANYLTPADRRARTQLMRMQRDPAYRRQKEKEELQRLEAANAASVPASAAQKEESNGFVTALHTVGDVGANVLTGLGKGLEGIWDLGAGIVGAVGGLFSDEFENDVKEHIAKDHVGDWFGNDWQEALDQSALNNSKVGQIIEGVAQGVGQMLPAVAVSLIPGVGPALGAKLALGTTIASAAGTSTEQAFQDGADYGEGVLYGAASGAIEGVTEKLTGGAAKAVFGKGLLDDALGSVAKSGIARVAKDAAGEGVEEMISEVANPALKTIYKGKDALKEYGEGDFWAGVGEAGVIGAGTSVAYGGTVGKVMRTSGVYADANNVLEHIGEQESRIAKGDLSAEQEQKARESIKKDYELLAKRLEGAKPAVRERVLKNPALAAAFDTSGTLKQDFVAQLDSDIKAAGDTSSGLDRRYYSASARGRETEIIEGLAAQGTKVYEGELSAAEAVAYKKAKKIHDKLRSMGFVNTDLVLSETMPDANAYLDGNTVVIGKDTLADGSYVKHLVHETTHFTEGTQEWVDVMDHVFGKDAKGVTALMEHVRTSGYGVTQADIDAVVKAVQEGTLRDTKLTKAQQTLVTEVVAMQMEETFGSEDAINRLVGEKPNLAKRIWERIKVFLQTFGKTREKDTMEVAKLRRTEELFRKALQNAGVSYAVDELKRTAAENAQTDAENGAESVDESGELRYNKKVPRGNDFVTQAMIWARSEATVEGEEKAFTNGDDVVVVAKTKEGYEEVRTYSNQNASDIDQIYRRVSENNEGLYGSLHSSIGAYKTITSGSSLHSGSNVGATGVHGQNGGIHRSQSRSNGVGSSQRGEQNRGSIKPVSQTFTDITGKERIVLGAGEGRYMVDGSIKNRNFIFDSPEAAIEAENKAIVESLAHRYQHTPTWVRARLNEDPHYFSKKIQHSRKATGDTVTISKGEMAKLHANYAGEKVFDKKSVKDALASVEAFQKLPSKLRTEFVNRIWTGYNQRLHQQGFEQFTEVMWHQLHATIMQEVGYDELGTMTEDQYAEAERVMDEQIVAALHQIVASGKPSVKARLESDTSTEGYRKQANYWREEHARVVERNKALGRIKYEVEKLANAKMGRYVNAANYRGDTFRVAISELAKMNWRGGLVRDAKIREHFATLDAWYCKDNPLYKGDGNGNELFRQDIKDALSALGNAQNGALTVEELQAAETVIKYFAHEIEAHNTIYKDGKRQDAMPEAKRYIEGVARAKEIAVKCGIWQRLTRSGFARMVADPAMLMRQADGYLNGFFTEQFEALRQGTIDAAVLERELAEEFEKFWEEHKAYGKRYNNDTVTFNGKEMPLQEALSLYMTMHREQAWAGLAGAGFEIDGRDATENISDGFADVVEKLKTEEYNKLPPEELLTLTNEGHARIERAALEKALEQQREALAAQFTDEDKALISITEKILEQCRDVKIKIDEIVQGYSNVTGGYYFPIRRAGLAENVDAWTGFEGDRVSNLSINKDTVKNAHKLYIEPVHIVFMRHLKAVSLYHGLGVFTDNFNRLYNLNTVENANNPSTVRSAIAQSNKYAKEMLTYFKELKQDVEGISKKRNSEKFYNDAVAYIRSAYATYQLGFNPKVWVTQLSSLIASSNILDADCLTKSVKVSSKDVDEYCRLAWLRNNDNAAAMAQAVETPQNAVQRAGRGVLRAVRDSSMSLIGKVDRLVIKRLFAACQVQVEKNGGAKIGTKENKMEAGKMLQRVILETQQNSLATERSAAMRSGDEFVKGFTMFSADAMKVGARVVDAFGELSALKTLRREAKKAGNTAEVERLNKEIKRAQKQCVRATVSLVGVAVFNALIAYGFKWLYRRDEEESVGTVVADIFGNMLGGIPLIRDFYSYFQDGFEMDHFLISTLNDVLGTAAASYELVKDAASGKEVTRQAAMGNMRKVFYAAGQLSGVPVRNVYNVTTGLLNRVSPETGYSAEAIFTAKAYSSDLKKAIEDDDEDMIGTIAGLMLDEKGVEDSARNTYRELIGKGYSVLPRSVGDSITVDGEKVELSGKQQKRFRAVYDVGQQAVTDLCGLSQFQKAEDAVQAKAIQFVNDVYWELAVSDLTGEDHAEKNMLFAEAIPIEKLAIIIATARAIEADKDKSGKAISGTKKRKVQTFVNSLHLTAAQKYMVMGYLGYSNINGAQQVKSYIGRLGLSKKEQAVLMKYSGYAE